MEYSKPCLVSEGRSAMPGLYLQSEDDFDFSRVFTIRFEQRLQDAIDGDGHFPAY